VIPFGDPARLEAALDDALGRRWDTEAILAYARVHQWDSKIESLVRAFQALVQPKTGRNP
jgi:flavin-binding protein dodecin